ncbi:PKD-like domain-containing protein [Flavobacterium suncheonense]|uniref:PKD-like domain-containing protein n=1 Tax=Flavobacterium suncheonense TaxID=350894 RepID=UPI003FA37D5C
MKKSYSFLRLFSLLLFSTFCLGQDCVTQKTVSDDIICFGQSASIVLSGSETGVHYQLRLGVTDVGVPLAGNGGDLTFTVSPATSTNYTIYVIECDITYTDEGVVTVNPIPDASTANSSQAVCSGFAIVPINFTGGIPGTTFNWTRDNTTNVTGIVNSGSGNISGTLINNTTSPQIVTFTITQTANGCDGTPITATVTVNPIPDVNTVTLSQTICSGESISDIVFTSNIPGTQFSWTRTNEVLTPGIAASGNGTISGVMTNSTTIPRITTFTVTPSANGCEGATISVTVTVNPEVIASASNPNQIRCSGVALGGFGITSNTSAAATTYTWIRDNTTNLTGIADSGTGAISGTLINNTNTPQTTTFTVIPSANGCQGNPITVTALINPNPVAGVNIPSQSICSGFPISDIIPSSNVSGTLYTWTRNNTINVTGIANNDLTFGNGIITGTLINNTISNQTVTFTFTPKYEGCAGIPTTVSATVIVYPIPTVATTNSSQTICSGNNITTIAFTGISGTTYNWVRDNTSNVTGIADSGSGNITGNLTNTTTTQQTVTFTITPERNGCSGIPITAQVIVEATSFGGAVTISQPNITPVVNIKTECHTASGTLYLSGHRGNVVRWEYSTNAGVSWTTIANTSTTHNYSNITATTIFRAVVQNGPYCALAYSTSSMINVIPNIKPTPVIATPATICNGGSSVLTAQSSYATSGSIATGGSFSNSNPPGWAVGGCGNCLNAGSSNTNPSPWQLSASNGGTYSGITYTSDGKFAIANGDFTSYLYTPTFNTFGLTTASLSFADAYNLQAGASIAIQISVSGGAYTTLWSASGAATRTPYLNFHTNPRSVDLSAYLGQPNLRIRFAYFGNIGSSWAVDNIAIPDVPTNLSTQWVDSVSGTVISNNTTITVSPTVTTTYAVTSFLNGCNSFGTDGTAYVTVNVNPRPTAELSQDQYVCYGGTATFTVHFTGNGPYRFTLFNGTTSTTYNNITPNASGDYTFNITNMTVTRTYSITALNDSKCTAITSDITGTATVTVLNGTQGLWTGLISSDWFDCRNWQRGLPSATTDAVIPDGSIRMPVIDPLSPYAAAYSYIAVARDVVIDPGASLTMAANSHLHVKRHWINRGIFIPGTGNVTFNSSTNNMIQNMNTAANTKPFENFYNLILNTTNGAVGVTTPDAFQLTVANSLILTSGDLRLTGEAQLVQNGSAPNSMVGTGNLLRDQQGTKSSFHYNYWSSPVSLNGTNYSVSAVLRDGTNAAGNPFNPGTISFGDGYNYSDGPISNPIKISNRWIYKYTTVSTSYSAWQPVGSTGTMKIGEGFTMKGVTGLAPNTEYQNYVFKGKPNNGDIGLTLSLNQLYLIGNPYPSALDADAFIKDNIKDGGNAPTNVFSGALYFWDHFGGENHYLGEYIGGYATYTLMGGTVAVSNDPMINDNNAVGTKIPKRYIPVGQGFFVRTDLGNATANMTSPLTGGTLIIKNSQRAFKTESPVNSVFFRNQNHAVDAEDSRQKIRLSFESPSGLKRHLLIGSDSNASNAFDLGYDAIMIDVNNEDMYWSFSNEKFVIQAVQHFNETQIIPIGIKVANAGTSTIKIENLENIDESLSIYLFDSETGSYHDLRNGNFQANLPIGEHNNRFSLRFTNSTLGTDNPELANGIQIFVNPDNILNIKNHRNDITVNSVELFNILGQSVKKWNVTDEVQTDILLPVQNLRSGVYIVNLKTSDGLMSKKVSIK